ncbi:MAG: outer membrane protein assembly factor BamA [Verrucomicrobiota bacterium]|jgi:outer membrane protein insertion porin family|nr:outer membrane protein assembly factor BamA [Verrucomicrobiota bacterium]
MSTAYQPLQKILRTILFVCLAAVPTCWAQQDALLIRDIAVEPIGLVPINAEQVLAHVSTRVGRELNRGALTEDIRSLQKSGAFSYAEARIEEASGGGIVLLFRVAGRPIIRHLTIKGADYMGNKKVRNLMEIQSGDRVDNALIGEKAQKARDTYRKDFFPNTRITWELTPVEDSPGFTDLNIRVEEGKRAVVRRILFKGNRHVPRRELLAVMAQKQSSWLTWINNDGLYEPAKILADREMIRKVFMDKGYLGAQVGAPTFEYVSAKKIDITFGVVEGPMYTLRDWRFQGVSLFPEQDLGKGVLVAPGQKASFAGIQRASQNIRDFYGSRGYIRTTVDPLITLDTNAASAVVTYDVSEGSLAYIQNIEIRGNSQTKDKVIRREINLAPGDVYNEVRVRSSENRVRNLNYFSYVGTYSESTTVSNRFNLIFDVEEQSTGQFTFGVGFSSIDNIVGYAELRQGNFDLFGWPRFTGGGQKLNLRVQIGDERTDLEMSWIEPWFMNRRLSLGINLFRRDARYLSDDYDQTTTGGTVTLGQPLFTFNRVNWIYGMEDIDIHNVSTNASERILAEAGGRLKSYGTIELIRDTRDSTFIPTRGFRGSVAATLAGGPFGGDTDTYQFRFRASQFVPLWFGHVLNIRGMLSMVEEYGNNDRVPIFDREFMGGPRTVRAFKFRKLGPKDEDGEPLGGRSAAYGTVEYTLPIVQKLRFALFYDVGVVWQGMFEEDMTSPAIGDGDVCDGYGIGVRLDLPQFPIQLDYAWPVSTDDMLGNSGRFSFTIGYTY